MNRKILVGVLFVATAAMVAAQSSQNPYEGTSNPPPDDTITDSAPPQPAPAPKPPAAQPVPAQPAIAQPNTAQPAMVHPALGQAAPTPDSSYVTGNDDGIVQVAPEPSASAQPYEQPRLNQRTAASDSENDPDAGIVHPAPLPPGELGDGTEIRARLLGRLSTAMNQPGDPFHARVASDVYRGNQILIPTGSEIDGTVVEVSSGRTGGHGSMLLRPETVVLPDGSRHRLYAQTMGAPGSRTRVGSEGEISPDSRLKKDSMEYGGAVGAGAITGAVVAGPVGALAGTLIGAGAITVHLLVNHPQATLEPGTVLLFSLTEPLDLGPADPQPVQQTAAQPIASN